MLRFAAVSTPACCRAELAPLRGAPGIQNILPSKLGSTTAGACHQTRSALQERAHVTWGCSTLLEAVGEDQVIAGAGLDAEIIEIEAVRHTTGGGIGGDPEAELHCFAGVFGDVDDGA